MRGIDNPVLKKELKLRFRSFKSFSGLLFYLLTLIIFVGGYFLVTMNFKGQGFISTETNIGLFTMISYVQLLLILFITPGVTAGAISTEREKQTLNILLTTSQSSWQIIYGKLTSSISYLLLLLFAGLPISSIVFLFGGVSPADFILVYVMMFIVLVAIASIGIMISTLIRKTITAMITTYSIMLVLVVLTGFFGFIGLSFNGSTNDGGMMPFTYLLLAINPLVHLATVIFPELATSLGDITSIKMSTWIMYCIFYVLIIFMSLKVATNKIRVNMNK